MFTVKQSEDSIVAVRGSSLQLQWHFFTESHWKILPDIRIPNSHSIMKNPKVTLFLIASSSVTSAASLSAQTILTDTFDNRTVGSVLNGSTTSDGNGYWLTYNGATDGGEVVDISGNQMIELRQGDTADQGLLAVRETGSSTSLQLEDGIISFDYYYFAGSSDNQSLQLQYRMAEDYTNLNNGGIQSGYQLRLTAVRDDTNGDYVSWRLQTDPNGTDPILDSGTFAVADFVNSSSNDVPGTVLSVELVLNGDSQQLSLNGTVVSTISDSSYSEGDGAFNFNSTTSRGRGFDDFGVSEIPEPASAVVWVGVAGLALATVVRRNRNG